MPRSRPAPGGHGHDEFNSRISKVRELLARIPRHASLSSSYAHVPLRLGGLDAVPTGSMNPTIVEGDRILVNKHVFGLRLPWTLVRLTDGRDPQRGEIVVFDSPVDGISLVKRVAGVPGDVVALDERGLIDQRPSRATTRRATRPSSPDCSSSARATGADGLPRGAACCPITTCCACPTPAARVSSVRCEVPEGMYLMLGDNRDNSADSRYIGFVPRRNIVGPRIDAWRSRSTPRTTTYRAAIAGSSRSSDAQCESRVTVVPLPPTRKSRSAPLSACCTVSTYSL